jgi:hypothetical protein
MEQEKELLDLFRKMDGETRDLFLSHGRIALVSAESTKRAILNGTGPLYAERGYAPMGSVGAALAKEAV